MHLGILRFVAPGSVSTLIRKNSSRTHIGIKDYARYRTVGAQRLKGMNINRGRSRTILSTWFMYAEYVPRIETYQHE